MYSFFWELHGLSPNFHIHKSVSDLYIPRIGPHIWLQQNMYMGSILFFLGSTIHRTVSNHTKLPEILISNVYGCPTDFLQIYCMQQLLLTNFNQLEKRYRPAVDILFC
jgi:hypothetical protein